MSLKEYQGVFDVHEASKKTNETLAKCGGIPVAHFESLLFTDYKRYFDAWLKKTREPLRDPNSPSASTSA
jgi:hypothetical protein